MPPEHSIDDQCGKYLAALDDIARELISGGLYATEHKLLRSIVLDYARRKAEAESRVVLGFEKQFISWEKYTSAIMNIATPEQENIAFEWEAARDSREAWQKLIDELA